jgi:hypothetical protein
LAAFCFPLPFDDAEEVEPEEELVRVDDEVDFALPLPFLLLVIPLTAAQPSPTEEATA